MFAGFVFSVEAQVADQCKRMLTSIRAYEELLANSSTDSSALVIMGNTIVTDGYMYAALCKHVKNATPLLNDPRLYFRYRTFGHQFKDIVLAEQGCLYWHKHFLISDERLK